MAKNKNLIIILLIIILILFTNLKNIKEKFSWSIPNTQANFETAVKNVLNTNLQAIQNLSQVTTALQSGSDYIFPSNLTVKGNLTIDKKITVRGGGDFNSSNSSDGRYYFEDSDNAGKLRIGGVWNTPGIYAEGTKNIMIGAGSNEINFQDGTLKLKKHANRFDIDTSLKSLKLKENKSIYTFDEKTKIFLKNGELSDFSNNTDKIIAAPHPESLQHTEFPDYAFIQARWVNNSSADKYTGEGDTDSHGQCKNKNFLGIRKPKRDGHMRKAENNKLGKSYGTLRSKNGASDDDFCYDSNWKIHFKEDIKPLIG